MIREEDISGKCLDHLGLVASTIEKIGLIEKIDNLLPPSNSNTTMGQCLAAMIMNGLGFIDDSGFIDNSLYMFPEFLANKPVDRLFKGNLKAEYFNNDALGRCLDAVYDYGVTNLFSQVAFMIGVEQNLLGKTFRIDTTSLVVYGDYDEDVEEEVCGSLEKLPNDLGASEQKEAEESSKKGFVEKDASYGYVPGYGYSEERRPDLKQMGLSLATTGKAGYPIWMEAHSGNASDNKTLDQAGERMEALCKRLANALSFMTIGESAMYDSCLKDASGMIWLTRVPETHQIAKELLQYSDDSYSWIDLPDGYKICTIEVKYKGVHQRIGIVYSRHAYEKECQTLEKLIEKTDEELRKELWHLSNQEFECQADAKLALSKFSKLKYHTLCSEVIPILGHKSKGGPAKDEKPSIIGYKIRGELRKDEQKISAYQKTKGKFLLSTNELDRTKFPDEEMLSEYKNQPKTESGFKFIKDDAFEVSSIFLKKPGRIYALMMVMTLCLMVYAISEYELRAALEEAQDTIPSQAKKETSKPSMQSVYRMFSGVHVVSVKFEERSQELVINLKDIHKKIIRYFGQRAMEIYGVT